MNRPTIGLIGAGRLARALLPRLRAAGYALEGIAGRRPAPVRALARRLGIPALSETTLAARSRLLLLAVPDRALVPLAGALARRAVDWRDRVVLHHAGALDAEALAPLRRAGAAVGVLHPLQVLGSSQAPLEGSWARVEGDPRAVRQARRLARDLGLRPFTLPPHASRKLYHAAASLASNDLVALLTLAEEGFVRTGMRAAEARQALAALAQGALLQWSKRGLAGAFTGPLARGDRQTLREQIRALRCVRRTSGEIHRALSATLERLARERELL